MNMSGVGFSLAPCGRGCPAYLGKMRGRGGWFAMFQRNFVPNRSSPLYVSSYSLEEGKVK